MHEACSTSHFGRLGPSLVGIGVFLHTFYPCIGAREQQFLKKILFHHDNLQLLAMCFLNWWSLSSGI
jgi:hypothetical protein